MKTLFFILATTTLLFHIASAGKVSAAPAASPAAAPLAAGPTNIMFINTSCQSTLYQALCFRSLLRYADTVQQDPALLARVAIGVSLNRAKRMANYVANLTSEAEFQGDPRAVSAMRDCISVYGDAVDQIRGSLKQMRGLGSGESLRFQMNTVQTYMSAALTNEDTCTEGLDDVKEDGPMKMEVVDKTVKVKQVTSNALALVNSYTAKVTNP